MLWVNNVQHDTMKYDTYNMYNEIWYVQHDTMKYDKHDGFHNKKQCVFYNFIEYYDGYCSKTITMLKVVSLKSTQAGCTRYNIT